jgi:hypothetical protein
LKNYGEIRASGKGGSLEIVQFLPWIDLLWFPVAFALSEKGKRLLACLFVLSCVLLLRLQVEFMTESGHARGYLHWLSSDVLSRGQVVYAFFIALFLLLAWFSKGVDRNIYLAASISILITAFCISSAIMVL